MKEIWKFAISVKDKQAVQMPKEAKILCVQVQREIPCIWALVDSSIEFEPRIFVTKGTGHAHPDETWKTLKYIGSYQLSVIHKDSFVGHVFEEIGEKVSE